MRPTRDQLPKSPTLSLSKTLSSSLIIGGLVAALAMTFALTSFYKKAEGDLTFIYLAWGLSYGLFALSGVIAATLFFLKMPTRPKWMKGASIAGIVYGALIALSGLPLGIVLKKTEFLVSLAIIGVCIVGIAVLTLKSYKEEFKSL